MAGCKAVKSPCPLISTTNVHSYRSSGTGVADLATEPRDGDGLDIYLSSIRWLGFVRIFAEPSSVLSSTPVQREKRPRSFRNFAKMFRTLAIRHAAGQSVASGGDLWPWHVRGSR